MSQLERAYIDSAGQTFKKVQAKEGAPRDLYYFKDGTPISENAFHGGLANRKFDGQNVNIAVPHEGGPGFRRKEVNPLSASNLGKELRLSRDDVPGQPQQQILIGGDPQEIKELAQAGMTQQEIADELDGVELYDTQELAELNENIVDRYGPDAVMKY